MQLSIGLLKILATSLYFWILKQGLRTLGYLWTHCVAQDGYDASWSAGITACTTMPHLIKEVSE